MNLVLPIRRNYAGLMVSSAQSVSDEHFQSYLEEFTFPFNRRTSRSRELVFRRLHELRLSDVGVITVDLVGELLGYHGDTAI